MWQRPYVQDQRRPKRGAGSAALKPGRIANRREILMALGAIALSPTVIRAQSRQRTGRIGILHPAQSVVVALHMAAFREGLGMAGSGGPEATLIVRMAEGRLERLPLLAGELIKQDIDAILAASPPAVRAAIDATRSLPIIAIDLESDPIAMGWAESLNRPGRNVTGVFLDLPDFSGKCLQLLREAVPSLSKVGVLWDPATGTVQRKAAEGAATALRLTLEVFQVSRMADLPAAFDAVARSQLDGVLILSSPLFGGTSELPASLTLQLRLPAITLFPQFAERGGLLAYGPDLPTLFRQAGTMTRKVLDAERAAEMPIERPTRFRFVVNLGTARRLNLALPDALLARADEVIE